MCNVKVRCPNAAQFVVTEDALRLINPFIFGGRVMYFDDMEEMMLLGSCLPE
jgi:hypothetical protein